MQDDIYWVRREASFALGALAKIIPKELVVSSLVQWLHFLSVEMASSYIH